MSFDIRPFVLDDVEICSVNTLLNEVFPKAGFTEALLQWQYTQNPEGQAVGFNAYAEDGKLVAHYATMPVTARLFGHEERGLLSLNTATHPSQTGKGLFTQLAKATYDRAATTGFGFVVGVANAVSTHGFVNKLDFQFVGPLRAMVGIGSPALGTDCALDFERLWSPSTLIWRLQHPAKEYGRLEHGNQSSITASTGFPFITAVLGRFESALLRAQQERRPVALQLHIGLNPAVDWTKSLYVNVPQRLRPSPLNLIFLDLTGRERRIDLERVLFRALDFDAY